MTSSMDTTTFFDQRPTHTPLSDTLANALANMLASWEEANKVADLYEENEADRAELDAAFDRALSAETEYRRIWREWDDERGRLLAMLDDDPGCTCLDASECTCNPRTDPCRACKRAQTADEAELPY